MFSFEEALQAVLDSARPLGCESIDLTCLRNRISAEDVAADMDMPPFDKALVDGYACRREDLANRLTVIETIQAGVPPRKAIGSNQCARIMTGAQIPCGADCVMMVEQTRNCGHDELQFSGQETSANISPKGQDLRTGEVVVPQGTRIRPQHMAVLASVGRMRLRVARRPEVAIITTGDELVEPSQIPGPSQIRNGNRYQLAAQIEDMGGIPHDYGTVPDKAAAIDGVFKTAVEENDVVLISGGISVGDFDLVPEILAQNNLKLVFRTIAMKPGKPTLFGLVRNRYCFGLPGNPVSMFVAFELLVKPFLFKLMGHDYAPPKIRMPLGKSLTRSDSQRLRWIPVTITDAGTVEPVDYHGSAHSMALSGADGLVRMEAGVDTIETGASVSVRLI